MRRRLLIGIVLVSGVISIFSASTFGIDIQVGTEVFGDSFEGNPDPSTLDAAKWTSFVSDPNAAVIMNENYPGTHVEIYSAQAPANPGNSRMAHISTVSPLDFSALSDDWWAQVAFKFPVQAGLWTAPNAAESSARQYVVLQGQHAINGTQANAQGFDLRAVRYGGGLWALAWHGFDDSTLRVAEILDDNAEQGYEFNDTQNYVVSVHRKSDGNVDIYLDKTAGDGTASELIATKPLIGDANPVGLTSGDWSTGSAGYLLLDWVNIGSGPTLVADGDFNDDGLVDIKDYVVWRMDEQPPNGHELWAQTYGQPSGLGTGGASSSAVPEPTSALQCLAICVLLQVVLPRLGAFRRRSSS